MEGGSNEGNCRGRIEDHDGSFLKRGETRSRVPACPFDESGQSITGANKCKYHHVRLHNRTVYITPARLLQSIIRLPQALSSQAPSTPFPLHPQVSSKMPAKPASTAGKAPASTASKAPAKTTAETKAKKATKTSTSADGDAKKKRRKTRKETYSSYIYKGARSTSIIYSTCSHSALQFSSKSTQTLVSRTRLWPS